jgi:hypothetical protein
MNRCFYAAKAILLGLFSAQILSTIQVHLSNADLYQQLTLIRDAGYLAMPNQQIMDSLEEFGPAFFGGLFFTLTAGAGLCLLSFVAAWVWDRILGRHVLSASTIVVLVPWSLPIFLSYQLWSLWAR